MLQVDVGIDPTALKKQYRKVGMATFIISMPALLLIFAYFQLSILVHPDKNRDDEERASKAFETVAAAHRAFQDEEKMSFVSGVIEEGVFLSLQIQSPVLSLSLELLTIYTCA